MLTETKLPGYWRWLAFLICLLSGTAIGLAGYYSGIAFEIRMWMRMGLCVLFLLAYFIFRQNRLVRDTAMAFLAISLGLLAAGLFGDSLQVWLGIFGENARAYAVAKIGETVPIIGIILLLVLLSGGSLKGLNLRRGRLGMSLLGGLLTGLLLFAYFLSQGGWQIFQGANLKLLLPDIGWISIFSIFNAFMEELWFRGLFLSRFEELLGHRSAFWLTALLFGLLHAFGSFTGTLGSTLLVGFTLLLGLAFGYIVQRTNSIWGAVLGHFFADFFLLLGYFATIS